MENARQKWVTISFVAASALTAFVLYSLSQKVVAIWDLESRYREIDLVLRAASVALGFIMFIVLTKHPKTSTFMGEVVAELEKVTWPTSKETSRATFVVMIMVLISSLLLGGIDILWGWLVKLVF